MNRNNSMTRWTWILLVLIVSSGFNFTDTSLADSPPGGVITKVVIVRHGEKDTIGTNPHLTAAGIERAGRLARMLADEPVSLLVSSDRARTRETLAPLAEQTGLTVTIVPVGRGSGEHARNLADTIKAHPGGTIVVSNHSDVIPLLIRELGMDEEILIPDTEYERIFIVFLDAGGRAILLRLRYGT